MNVCPFLCFQHGLSVPRFLFERYFRMMLIPHYTCDALVCSSKAAQTALRNLLAILHARASADFGIDRRIQARVEVIPLAIDTDTFRPSPDIGASKQAIGMDPDSFVITYIGFVSLIKSDLGVLFRIFRYLLDSNPHCKLRLVIAGTGNPSYVRGLSVYVGQLGLGDAVSFVPHLTDENKLSILWATDVFVSLPDTTQESFGLTPIEAMACGVPQIGADWSGYRESIVDGQTGFLVPTSWFDIDPVLADLSDGDDWHLDHATMGQSVIVDTRILVDRFQQLIRHATLRKRMSEGSRRHAVQEFSQRTFVARFAALADQLCDIATAVRRVEPSLFDSPRYFATYGHYASQVTGTKEHLSVQPQIKPHDVELALCLAQSELPGVTLFDASLLAQLLEAAICAPGGTIAAETLIGIAGPASRASALRHMQWLRKQGFLIPAISDD